MSSPEPRVPPLPESQWSEELREILAPTRATGRGRVLNIFRTLAHHPKLLKRWLVFGNHVLAKSTLPPRERELVILRVGWLCRSEYEWAQHVVIGRRTGLRDEEIRRVTLGPDAGGWTGIEALLLRAADELHRSARIADATWKGLAAELEPQQLIDLVFTVGQYTLVSMALNTLGVQLDPGLAGFPSDPAGPEGGGAASR